MQNSIMPASDPVLPCDAHQIIMDEAICLENHDWDKWLELYCLDCIYWVPAWRRDGKLASDPKTELSLIYYDSRAGLEDRVMRLKSAGSPASRLLSRTTHIIGNIRAETGIVNDRVSTRSSWITYSFSPRTNRSDVFFGNVEHTLTKTHEGWRILRKKIILNNDYVGTMLDVYLL